MSDCEACGNTGQTEPPHTHVFQCGCVEYVNGGIELCPEHDVEDGDESDD
jgi:hypothetical protein